MVELFRKIISGFVIKISGLVGSFAFTILISQYFGAEGMGAFALTTTYALVLTYIAKLGLDSTFLKYASGYYAAGHIDKSKSLYIFILKGLVPLTILFGTLIFILSDTIAVEVIQRPDHKVYIQYAVLIMIPTVLSMLHSEGLRAFNMSDRFIFIQNASTYLISLLISLLCILFFHMGSGTWLLPVQIFLFSSCITMVISFLWWYPKVRAINNSEEKEPIKDLISAAMPLFMSSMLILILGWTDSILLGLYHTEYEVGLYNVSLKIANLVFMPTVIVGSMMAPRFAKGILEGSDRRLFRVHVRRSVLMTFFLSFPIFLLLFIFPGEVLLLFGKDFLGASLVLVLLSAVQMINALTGPKEMLLQMTHNEVFLRNVMILAVVTNFGANLLLIPNFGVIGAAVSSIVSMIVWNFATVIFIAKKLKVNIFVIPVRY